MSALFLALALFGLTAGAALIAWPRRAAVPADAPAPYARRIAGAMLVGASLFLGGFTLAGTRLT